MEKLSFTDDIISTFMWLGVEPSEISSDIISILKAIEPWVGSQTVSISMTDKRRLILWWMVGNTTHDVSFHLIQHRFSVAILDYHHGFTANHSHVHASVILEEYADF